MDIYSHILDFVGREAADKIQASIFGNHDSKPVELIGTVITGE